MILAVLRQPSDYFLVKSYTPPLYTIYLFI